MSRKAKQKQIEKEAQQIQQVQRAIQRTRYMALAQPQPFIYPYDSYRIHMDIVIFENRRSICLLCPSLANDFRINHVDYDQSKKLLRIHVADKQYGSFASWKYVVARFRSFGDVTSCGWADAIKIFCTNYERRYAPQQEPSSQKKILDISTSLNIETALSRIDAGPGVPLYITHFVEENNVIKYKEAILSQPLLDMLDYNRDALTSYLFTSGGLPHFLSTTEKDRSDLYWVDLRTALSKEVVVSEEHSTYLITKSQEKKPVIEKHYWIYERKKGYPDEAVCIYVYKEDPSRLLPNEPTSNEVLAMHSNDSSQSNRAKDVQAFFKKFYNEDFLDPEAILKSTCAYRILMD